MVVLLLYSNSINIPELHKLILEIDNDYQAAQTSYVNFCDRQDI